MKPCRPLFLLTVLFHLAVAGISTAREETGASLKPIPWSEIGAKATADYSGDGLTVCVDQKGAVRLRCAFQKLGGEVTEQGLWLTSTVEGKAVDRFRVVADYAGRSSGPMVALSERGAAACDAGLARFIRPGLREEYSVSADGVRQDFVVEQPPLGEGALSVELALNGAHAIAMAQGVQLMPDKSGRELAYSRLRVTDVSGKVLPAQLELVSATRLTVVVDDAGAAYPVRIDPTFSDANWVSMGGIVGASDAVSASVTDGLGNLYIGGGFTAVGNVAANKVAKWNGNEWSALGTGLEQDYASVRAMAVSGDDLFVCGIFSKAGGQSAVAIAKWNSATGWSSLGSGFSENANLYALAVMDGALYVGGDFTSAGGVPANKIAKWNGSTWSALGSGMDSSVWSLAVAGSTLYAGGGFTTAGGVPANNIARWNGSAWSALGSGTNDLVSALLWSGSNLYAGGAFTRAGTVTARGVARWNGNAWSALGTGMQGESVGPFTIVRSLALLGSDLYAGGAFATAGTAAANGIARWNGIMWSTLGAGLGPADIESLSVLGNELYVGGTFTTVYGAPFNYLAKWNGSVWSKAAGASGTPGPDHYVNALAVQGSDLYAGGDFTTADGVPAKYIAKWNGSAWSPLGPGLTEGWAGVLTMAVSGGDLYAGGEFNRAGEVTVGNVARWNGSDWSALGSGLLGFGPGVVVKELVVSGSELYAGGDFTTAGGLPARGIARWDGSTWSAVGESPFVSVEALAVSGSDVYAGGNLDTTGGGPVWGVAKWNGSAWSILGGSMNDEPRALALMGNHLYAGGFFTSVGTLTANGVACWDGNSWSALGTGVQGSIHFYGYAQVWSLLASGTDLYVGGSFASAGGVPANGIAKWDGSTWSALGTGMNRPVFALAITGSDLYAGGSFATAGGKVSANIARAYLVAPHGGVADSITGGPGMATVKFYGNPGRQFDVERATSLAPPVEWSTLNTSPLTPGPDGAFSFTDPGAPAGRAFYRGREK